RLTRMGPVSRSHGAPPSSGTSSSNLKNGQQLRSRSINSATRTRLPAGAESRSGGAEAEGGPLLLDERAEADAETDGDLVEGDVHDPAEQRDALAELDDGHRVGGVGREGARRDTDHREALDGALAAERHRPPGALVTGRTEQHG